MRVVTRFGSVADGDLGIDSGEPGLTARRRAIVDLPWTWLNQVHGSDVVTVTEPGGSAGLSADAAVTAVAGAVLAVQTADCAPVLLSSPQGVIGAAHAGWRGLAAGVIGAAVAAMRALGAIDIAASLGPCIAASSYEFSSAELTTLAFRFGPDVVGATRAGAPAFDLRIGVRQALREVGVELDRATGEPPDTASDLNYFSWRARGDVGRQSSVIWLEP
jgi:YfiH family protein